MSTETIASVLPALNSEDTSRAAACVSRQTNIAAYAVDLLAAYGTDTVFSLAGGMSLHLNRAVALHAALTPVYCQHEQACVAAAEGYAKASNFRRAGVAVITSGPGVSNSVTSLISAYGDSTPLIVLAGQIKTADIDRYGTRTHGMQEIRSQELISPCVKRFVRLDSARYRSDLVEAIAEAFRGRPGPVFIEIPLDVQGLPISYAAADLEGDIEAIRQSISLSADTLGSRSALQQALEQLLHARCPLLYVGNGCRVAGVEAAVQSLIARHALPAVFSWLSFDMLPSSDPSHFGCPGGLAPIYANQLLAEADCILFLGARLDLGTTAFQRDSFGAQAHRCFVDVDAHELAKFRTLPRSECIQADLRHLPGAIEDVGHLTSAAESDWLHRWSGRRESYLLEESKRLTSEKLTVYGIAKRLSQWSEDKVFVTASSGYAIETFIRFFAPGEKTRAFHGAALGSMGLGLPHAIGAAFASGRRVVCVEADGGIMLNLQELATLSHASPRGFILFLLNNDGYESIRASQTRYFGQAAGVDDESGLYIPEFEKIAAAFKLRYTRVQSLAELDALLIELAGEQAGDVRPLFVDLCIERDECRGPSVKTQIDQNGRPYSSPLAELSW